MPMSDSAGELQVVEKTLVMDVSIKDIAPLLEDPSQHGNWNPLSKRITPLADIGQGPGATWGWTASILGVSISGTNQVTSWIPDKEYGWRGTEKHTGLGIDSKITLVPKDDKTSVTARLSYIYPKDSSGAAKLAGVEEKVITPILNAIGAREFLDKNVEEALKNINNLASQGKKPSY